jgi:hypothetical protein
MTDDEARLDAYMAEVRAKYNSDDLQKMQAKGQAMAPSTEGGDPSYPIADEADLTKAIKAVGRGNASHDAIRKHIMARAKALKLSASIPDNWNADGSISQANAAGDDLEGRAHDPFTGTHSHAHGTMGDQGGDETHDHEHGHSGDSSHGHEHPSRSASPLAERGEFTPYRETREIPFTDAECRMDSVGGGMTFRGYASIFDSPYPITDAYGEYQETVTRGAFDKTLAEGADVVFLINHDGAPLARSKSGTMQVRTDGKGLLTEAKLDPANPRAQELKSMVDRGDMDEMSFTFRDLRPTWNGDYTERNLREVSIHHGDVSGVNFGANGATKGTLAMRSRQFALVGFDPFSVTLKELRSGATLSGTSAATLKHVLSLVAAADTAVDQAQPLLAELLGVPNPDVAQDAALDRALKRALGVEQYEQVKRALGDVCNCCPACTGAMCDGTCCDICTMPDIANAEIASSATDDNPIASLAFDSFEYEARIAIMEFEGAR